MKKSMSFKVDVPCSFSVTLIDCYALFIGSMCFTVVTMNTIDVNLFVLEIIAY